MVRLHGTLTRGREGEMATDDLTKAAELVLKYVNDNRRARASHPDADLPIEAAMRLLAEHNLEPACEYCGYRGSPAEVDDGYVCCAGCGEWEEEEIAIGERMASPRQKSMFGEPG